jgi:hypothetical protein
MNPPDAQEEILQDALEDVALLIGAAAAAHHLADDLVWTLLRRLSRLRDRALSRVRRGNRSGGSRGAAGHPHRSHPAVEEFLLRNGPVGEASAASHSATKQEAVPCQP